MTGLGEQLPRTGLVIDVRNVGEVAKNVPELNFNKCAANLLIVCFRQMDSRLVRYTLIKLFVGK